MNDLLVRNRFVIHSRKKELPSYLKNVFYSDNGSQYICLISRITNIGSLKKKHKFDQNWHDSKVLIELYRKNWKQVCRRANWWFYNNYFRYF